MEEEEKGLELYSIHIRATNERVFQVTRYSNGVVGSNGQLTDDFVSWMNEQVGEQSRYIMDYKDWYLDPGSHWHDVHSDSLTENKSFYYYTIWLKDPKHHLLMKLTWGGS